MPSLSGLLKHLQSSYFYNYFVGCSKCHKVFNRTNNITDYSGFDTVNWTKRDGEDHKRLAIKTLDAKTKTILREMESTEGVRYSELHRLPYYDPVRMHVIDPMHNLLLGLSKHAFETWLEKEILTSDLLEVIEGRIELVKIPSDLGRIPVGITKYYKTMKADEWKHWTLVYSNFCLHGVLPSLEYSVWCIFAKACRILCKQFISDEENSQAHDLLVMYCKKFEELYGKKSCVPNMHMSLHIADCIRDYGPTYAFWCFSFERFNGLLGKYTVNNHAISVQLMRKFIADKQLLQELPDELKKDTTNVTSCNADALRQLWILRHQQRVKGADLEFLCEFPCTVYFLQTFLKPECDEVELLYQKLYKNKDLRLGPFVKRCKRLRLGNEIVAMETSRSTPYSMVLARWPDFESQQIILRPAVITGLYQIKVLFEDDAKTHFLAKVKWLKENQHRHCFGFSSNLQVWNTDYISQPFSFIPAKFIKGRCVTIKQDIDVTGNGNYPLVDRVNIIMTLPTRSIIS